MAGLFPEIRSGMSMSLYGAYFAQGFGLDPWGLFGKFDPFPEDLSTIFRDIDSCCLKEFITFYDSIYDYYVKYTDRVIKDWKQGQAKGLFGEAERKWNKYKKGNFEGKDKELIDGMQETVWKHKDLLVIAKRIKTAWTVTEGADTVRAQVRHFSGHHLLQELTELGGFLAYKVALIRVMEAHLAQEEAVLGESIAALKNNARKVYRMRKARYHKAKNEFNTAAILSKQAHITADTSYRVLKNCMKKNGKNTSSWPGYATMAQHLRDSAESVDNPLR